MYNWKRMGAFLSPLHVCHSKLADDEVDFEVREV
jgi:hypothetical protein